MDTNKKDDEVVSEAEKQAEAEAQKDVKEEEIRLKIVTEFGFDEVDDVERIDKLVAKELENRKKLSEAIGQKIKHRTKAQELAAKIPEVKKDEVKIPSPEDFTKTVSAVVSSTLEKERLESLEYPDDLKAEISRLSQGLNKPIKEVLKDPYIVAKIADYERERRSDEATITRNNNSGGQGSSILKVPQFDMATQEGREKYDKWKAAEIKKGN